jgi:hypothetical protein
MISAASVPREAHFTMCAARRDELGKEEGRIDKV